MGKSVKFEKAVIRRVVRKDKTIHLSLKYSGHIHSDPKKYNKAFATVLREMAKAIEKTHHVFADPEVVVWCHVPGKLTAEVTLSN